MSGFRIRVYPCAKVGGPDVACWYFVDRAKVQNVGQLIHEIAKCLRLPNQHHYRLTLDGLRLLASSPIDVLEKDDAVKVKIDRKSTANVETDLVPIVETVENGEEKEDEEGPTKKKRRNRKKKVREIRTPLTQFLSQLTEEGPKRTVEVPTANRKHIRFEEDEEPSFPVLSKQFCSSEKQQNSSTVYHVSNGNEESLDSSSEMEAENGGVDSPPHFINDPWRELSRKWSEKPKETNGCQEKQQLANFPPTVGSQVTFKMLELTEKFSPELSDWKVGTIKSVDSETGLVTFELSQGTIATQNEDGTNEPQKVATVSWSSLCEPRLVC